MTTRHAAVNSRPLRLEVSVGRRKPIRVGFSEPGLGGVVASFRTGDRPNRQLSFSVSASAGSWGLNWLETRLKIGQAFTVTPVRGGRVDAPISRREYGVGGPRTFKVVEKELKSAQRNLALSREHLRDCRKRPERWTLPVQVRDPRPAPLSLRLRINDERPMQAGVMGRGGVVLLVELENPSSRDQPHVWIRLFGSHGHERVRWIDNRRLEVGDVARVSVQPARPLTEWRTEPREDMSKTLRWQITAVRRRIKKLKVELAELHSARRSRSPRRR